MTTELHDIPSAPTLEWLGHTYRTLLTSQESGGALCVVETTAPAGDGPPRHIHTSEDESFFILEGEVEFWVAGQSFRRSPGQTACVPRGTEHTFKPVTDLRMLIMLTPGGFEGFFADMARGAFRIPQDMPAIVESAARHKLTFTGPPL